MYFFKKIILIIVMGGIFPSLAEGLVSLPLLYPLKNSKQFNETSRYISSLRYSWVVSSYLPEHMQQFVGSWHIQLGGGWLHTIPRRNNAPIVTSKDQKTIKETGGAETLKMFISYYPAVVTTGLYWEMNYLHYIRPTLGLGYAFNNPFENSVLLENSFLDKKSYFITAGLLLSFDIVDSNFSHRMNYEYNIRDMGLLVEYQKYYSLQEESNTHWGVNIGLFLAF